MYKTKIVAGIYEAIIFIKLIFIFFDLNSTMSIAKKKVKKKNTGSQIKIAKGRQNNL
tara:strand:+ start:495 stop:665 length:171 start_codon:yes stop_codon:yes gene_type:complete